MELTICTLTRDHDSDSEWMEWQKKQFLHLKKYYAIESRLFSGEINNFSEARNKLAGQTENSWILMLDSDEYILLEDLHRLFEMTHLHDGIAYYLPRNNYFGDYEHVRIDNGCYPDIQARLYNKNMFVWKGKVHEYLEKNQPSGIGYLKLNIHIQHFGYLKDPEFQVEKHRVFHKLRGVDTTWKYPKLSEVTTRKVDNVFDKITKELEEI